ncbi:39S ribosomal protein L18, mitochondrial [Microplitis demolitor]|uniref:39S ribosomal protein L18, mitochondrial n=1 Tax=Microplitis demolitor TaxID=69319 RepID=UPI00043FFE2B|nr:39S ribosomal protein L18, mitochondrial [Microplitis demolitor]
MMNAITRLQLFNLSKVNIKKIHSNAALVDNCTSINNRNPRNLEYLRIAHRPHGYHLEKVIPSFWHKLVLTRSAKYITFDVQHFENGVVVSASSQEWPIKKRLYRCQDSAAYINLGRILAQRCLESGILFIHADPELPECEKTNLALQELIKEGITLNEPLRYIHPNPWDLQRPEKPWEIYEN